MVFIRAKFSSNSRISSKQLIMSKNVTETKKNLAANTNWNSKTSQANHHLPGIMVSKNSSDSDRNFNRNESNKSIRVSNVSDWSHRRTRTTVNSEGRNTVEMTELTSLPRSRAGLHHSDSANEQSRKRRLEHQHTVTTTITETPEERNQINSEIKWATLKIIFGIVIWIFSMALVPPDEMVILMITSLFGLIMISSGVAILANEAIKANEANVLGKRFKVARKIEDIPLLLAYDNVIYKANDKIFSEIQNKKAERLKKLREKYLKSAGLLQNMITRIVHEKRDKEKNNPATRFAKLASKVSVLTKISCSSFDDYKKCSSYATTAATSPNHRPANTNYVSSSDSEEEGSSQNSNFATMSTYSKSNDLLESSCKSSAKRSRSVKSRNSGLLPGRILSKSSITNYDSDTG